MFKELEICRSLSPDILFRSMLVSFQEQASGGHTLYALLHILKEMEHGFAFQTWDQNQLFFTLNHCLVFIEMYWSCKMNKEVSLRSEHVGMINVIDRWYVQILIDKVDKSIPAGRLTFLFLHIVLPEGIVLPSLREGILFQVCRIDGLFQHCIVCKAQKNLKCDVFSQFVS